MQQRQNRPMQQCQSRPMQQQQNQPMQQQQNRTVQQRQNTYIQKKIGEVNKRPQVKGTTISKALNTNPSPIKIMTTYRPSKSQTRTSNNMIVTYTQGIFPSNSNGTACWLPFEIAQNAFKGMCFGALKKTFKFDEVELEKWYYEGTELLENEFEFASVSNAADSTSSPKIYAGYRTGDIFKLFVLFYLGETGKFMTNRHCGHRYSFRKGSERMFHHLIRENNYEMTYKYMCFNG